MKKKGDRWKKFENLEKNILIIINKSKIDLTVNEVRRELNKEEIKTSWRTVKDYLQALYDKGKISKESLIRFSFWGKK